MVKGNKDTWYKVDNVIMNLEILSRLEKQDNIFLFDKSDNSKIQLDKELKEIIIGYYEDRVYSNG